METTIDLLSRVKTGDDAAVRELIDRSVPSLSRWARGRLPASARSMRDTEDLVQDAIVGTIPRLAAFEASHPGALQAFLRQAVADRIGEEVRNAGAAPAARPSPLEHQVGHAGVERYERALARLEPAEREAIVARVELQQSYEEVALALGAADAAAARLMVTRALGHLVHRMAIDH